MESKLKLVECPRDAMQGWPTPIPTQEKIDYLNALLKVGFHTIDCGSFVSTKAIPQMADTAQVLNGIDLSIKKSRLLTIVANLRGAEEAVTFDAVDDLGFPFSVSPTFQLKNTNKTIAESFEQVKQIQSLCVKNKKQLVIYFSMAFGNPYGDDYNAEVLQYWAAEMDALAIKCISLADTVGLAEPEQITKALHALQPQFLNIEFGVHLHAQKLNAIEKIKAAYQSGCKRFDSAIGGIGGCPMAGNALVGNLDTAILVKNLEELSAEVLVNKNELANAEKMAQKIFI
jgi:hydroxymethylglutaryl-CoA lyase